MLNAARLVSTIEALGISLRLVDGRVRMSGNREALATLAPELRTALREKSVECIAYLSARRDPQSGCEDADSISSPRRAQLAPHLRDFWQCVLNGELDVSFTNWTQRLVDVRGPLDVSRLRAATDDLIAMHPILDCTLQGPDHDWQVETPTASPAIFLVHAMPAGEGQLRELVHELAWRPLRADRCMHRFFVVSNERDRHVIGLVLHHFVADQQSVAIAWKVLWQRYHAHSVGLARLRPPAERVAILQMTDPHETLSDPLFARERSQWHPERMRIVESSMGRCAQGEKSADAALQAVRHIAVPAHVPAALVRLGQSLRSGMLPILLAAQAIVLQRHTGQQDLGALLLKRGRHTREEQHAIGNFTHTVPVATPILAQDDLATAASRIHAQRIAALALRPLPYDTISRILWPAGAPLLPLVNYIESVSASASLQTGLLQFAPFDAGPPPPVPCRSNEFAAHYLQINFDGSALTGFFRYSPRLVAHEAADVFVREFIALLESCACQP